jgi:hypothetical protein
VVKDALCSEVIETWSLWIELHAHDLEGLSFNQTDLWENLESLSRVLEDLEVDWSITGVVNLYSLVDTLVRSAWWEVDFVLWGNLDHGNERLTSWWERMSNQS